MADQMNFVDRYDSMMLADSMRALYAGDFYNVGWWANGAQTLDAACAALVCEHAARIDCAVAPTGLVLDVGCGLGAGAAILAARWPRAQVVGLNISHRQLAIARRHYPAAAFCVMDATVLAVPDAAAEAIISVEAALHFPSRVAFLAEARRALRPHGRLVLTDLLVKHPAILGGWQLPEGHGPADLDAYATLCRDAGFNIESLADVTAATWHGFCRYLASMPPTAEFAQVLRPAVTPYLFACLRRI